jgi:hypothetical protein
LDNISEKIIMAMNGAAEKAAPKSVDIFSSAITAMTLTDGLNLLNSSDSTAATQYLNGNTFSPLTKAYTPIIDSTIALVPLTEHWSSFRNTYNSALSSYNDLLGFQTSWNNDMSSVPVVGNELKLSALKSLSYGAIETESLGEWTTIKALDGLFFLVGGEEKKIRRDPLSYVGDLLGDAKDIFIEVFDEIMDMES